MNTEHLFTKDVFNHLISYYVCYNENSEPSWMRVLDHPLDSLRSK